MEDQVRSELMRAKKLIQAGRYEQARGLLITIDHPTADKWLEKLNQVASTASSTTAPTEKSYTWHLVAMILLYMLGIIPGLIFGQIFAGAAKRDIAKYSPPPQYAKAVVRLQQFVVYGILIVLVVAVVLAILATISLKMQGY